MEATTAAPARRVFIDFEPTHDLLQGHESDTYVIHLPGFKKEQLRVQLSNSRKLIATGERFLADDRWSRFRKEFPLPPNCKADGIRARFDNGLLYIMLPKSVQTPEQGKGEKPTATTRELEKSVDDHAISKREDTSSVKRERSSIRKALEEEKEREERERGAEKEEKKGREERGDEKKDASKNIKDKMEQGKEEKEGRGGRRSGHAVGSFTERMRQKMRKGMEFDGTQLQSQKVIIVGFALAAALMAGWYLHHRMNNSINSGEW